MLNKCPGWATQPDPRPIWPSVRPEVLLSWRDTGDPSRAIREGQRRCHKDDISRLEKWIEGDIGGAGWISENKGYISYI